MRLLIALAATLFVAACDLPVATTTEIEPAPQLFTPEIAPEIAPAPQLM